MEKIKLFNENNLLKSQNTEFKTLFNELKKSINKSIAFYKMDSKT